MMTEHKARPEPWQADAARWLDAIIELRDRVEALEATSKPSPNSSQIGSSLAKRVQHAIYIEYARSKGVGCPEARAAIREVAVWLREHYGGPTASSTALEQEAER